MIRVSVWHLRRLFKRGGFWERAQSGELTQVLAKNSHLTREKAAQQEQPYCTHSQTVRYLDGSTRVAVVHQYLAPDGISLGGSGLPDPKYLEFNGESYAEWSPETYLEKLWCWAAGWIAGVRYKLLG